jgi:hypothetical protein
MRVSSRHFLIGRLRRLSSDHCRFRLFQTGVHHPLGEGDKAGFHPYAAAGNGFFKLLLVERQHAERRTARQRARR